MRVGRDQLGHQLHGRLFFQYPGGTALRILIDRPRLGTFLAAINVRQVKRHAIRYAVMAGGMNQPYGIVRRHAVEISSVNIAMPGEFAFIPSLPLNPFARLRFRYALAH